MYVCKERTQIWGLPPPSHREGTHPSLSGSQAVSVVALGESGVQLVSFWSPLVSAVSVGVRPGSPAAHPSVPLAGPWGLSNSF